MKYHTRLAGWLMMIAGAGLCFGGEGGSAQEPKERANRDAHGEVLCMAITPDGKTLATGTWDRITLWDAATGKELHTLKRHKGAVPCVAVSPYGKPLASGSFV
jgi:WD40 repeat protein